MTSKHPTLASLTAMYMDSDAENEEEEEVEKGEKPPEESKGSKLVSGSCDVHVASSKGGLSKYSKSSVEEGNDSSSDEDLPPKPTGRCPPELQQRVVELQERIKAKNIDMTKHIQELKSFRNPSIYEKLIEYCNINEYGTNYPPHLYDPTTWGKESYYDELAKVQKAEMEKREKERKEKSKVEIMSGTAKHVTSKSGSAVVSGTQMINRSGTLTSKVDKKKKTKWDQVSGR